MSNVRRFGSRIAALGISVAAVLLVTFVMLEMGDRVNPTTVALGLLLTILISATFLGRNPALAASLAAMLCFNFFFLPPIRTWTIADPQNLVAWAAFTITAVIAGELSAFAKRRADESKELYNELQVAFDEAAKTEALRQSEKMKSALLDAVTHDLRTPLTSIKASVTTLLDSEGGHRTIELDSRGRKEFLDIINEETDRLNKFIEGMVELARVESGGTLSTGSLSSVEEAIAAAIVRAESLAGEHRITVRTDADLPLVKADARAVAEVIFNLLDNAVKYSPDGTKITITARRSDNGVEVSVNDQGQGIPVEMRERVFEKFTRGASGRHGGLGLGLAIAKGLAEGQNGSIVITEGDNGIGTKVIVTLAIGE
ncbi:MAG: DUF4118 domain-containing protein [Acidobacteria bacterium]|nr:DUF4118 domain-containing protein [Acidobacteriota bacterium]MCW5949276.1 DUF4118 domain-containing protein [Pyrinomonadaceae bacterium]